MIGFLAILATGLSGSGSLDYPFHLSTLGGWTTGRFVQQDVWVDVAEQVEYEDLVFLRLQGGAALNAGNSSRGKVMHDGSPVPSAYGDMFTLAAGHEWRWGGRWIAMGAGWAWGRYDTLVTYDDPRDLYTVDGDSLRYTSSIHEGFFGPVEARDAARWIWSSSTTGNSPYLMAEAGAGWEHFGVGIRTEYRFSPNIGLFLRYRLP